MRPTPEHWAIVQHGVVLLYGSETTIKVVLRNLTGANITDRQGYGHYLEYMAEMCESLIDPATVAAIHLWTESVPLKRVATTAGHYYEDPAGGQWATVTLPRAQSCDSCRKPFVRGYCSGSLLACQNCVVMMPEKAWNPPTAAARAWAPEAR